MVVSAASTVVAVPEEKENAPAASAVVTATALATATVEIKAEIDSVVELPPSTAAVPWSGSLDPPNDSSRLSAVAPSTV